MICSSVKKVPLSASHYPSVTFSSGKSLRNSTGVGGEGGKNSLRCSFSFSGNLNKVWDIQTEAFSWLHLSVSLQHVLFTLNWAEQIQFKKHIFRRACPAKQSKHCFVCSRFVSVQKRLNYITNTLFFLDLSVMIFGVMTKCCIPIAQV